MRASTTTVCTYSLDTRSPNIRMQVSSTESVLEGLRLTIVAELKASGLAVPMDAESPGKCFDAVLAWHRLHHRAIPRKPRTVCQSRHLSERALDISTEKRLALVRSEVQQGAELSGRLTRQFFKTGFNDFLFNNFGIQHLHLGISGEGRDATKRHSMAAGTEDLLFVIVLDAEVHFIDVVDHSAFSSPAKIKSLIQIVSRERPELLAAAVPPGVVSAKQSFEDAYELAKSGFSTVYELDGICYLTGGTVLDGLHRNGRRAPCTSVEVVDRTNRSLNMVVSLVEHVQENAEALIEAAFPSHQERPSRLALEVVEVGSMVRLIDRCTGLEFAHNGATFYIRSESPPGS